jgi:hypothetical protein
MPSKSARFNPDRKTGARRATVHIAEVALFSAEFEARNRKSYVAQMLDNPIQFRTVLVPKKEMIFAARAVSFPDPGISAAGKGYQPRKPRMRLRLRCPCSF